MSRYIDLTGQRFGLLTVMGSVPKRPDGRMRWTCHCDCGNTTVVRADCLRSASGTRSCGCLLAPALAKVVRHQDLKGKRFGRLVALRRVGVDDRRASLWLCRCDCGAETRVRIASLNSGTTRSCGCLGQERLIEARTTHGLSRTRLYRIWRNMKQRCSNPKAAKFAIYGGRGITVCDDWQRYEPFHDWAIANGYANNLTIDRIDNDGPYSPENCRWASYADQARNSSGAHLITFHGKTQCLTDWASERGINASALSERLHRYGWSVERALTTPTRERRTR